PDAADRVDTVDNSGPAGAAGAAGAAGFDEVVDLAASLLASAAETASPARVVTVTGRLDLEVPASVDGLGGVPPDVLARLATLRPQAGPARARPPGRAARGA